MSYTSTHHSFSTELANKYGMERAVIIHHFQHWIKINRRLKKNLKEGKTWTYQKIEDIAAHFSYLTEHQVRRIIDFLVKEEVLVKGNFNKSGYDRTTWYAFKCEETFIGEREHPHRELADLPNPQADLPNPKDETAKTYNDIDSKPTSLNQKKSASANAPRLYGKFVKLKDEEYDALAERYGQRELDSTIDDINNHLASKGLKPHKDYAATIRSWMKRKNPTAEHYSHQEKENRWFIRDAKTAYPEAFKSCIIRGKYVINSANNDELLLDINHETFKDALIKMFGKKKNVSKMQK